MVRKIYLLVLILSLAACAPANQNDPGSSAPTSAATSAPPAQASPTAGQTAAAEFTATAQKTATAEQTATAQQTVTAAVSPTPQATATQTVHPGVTFRNPVIRNDFPDPFILQVGEQYYAYGTNTSGRNVQVAVSEDLIEWDLLRDAMPVLPDWAVLGGLYVWAPEVLQVGERFILYYTARDKEADKQCVGVAVSDKPEGRFRDERDEPLVCQTGQGGTIDASPFQDGDKLYLLFKNDGNCCGRTTWIWVQEMAPDGLSLVGEPVQLVSNDKPWEGGVIEAPTMVKHEEQYYLFYSGNNYAGVEYSVGYAVCETVTGPCEDAPENPILKSYLKKPPVFGPGHQTLLQVEGEWWIVYHAWEVTPQGVKTSRRQVWLDPLVWEDGKPVVQGPNPGVQPEPEAP